MKNIEKILFKALLLDGNETYGISNNTYEKFRTLLIELTKIKYNIRYCSDLNCLCHPESNIKKLLEYEELAMFLEDNRLLEDIVDLINNYDPIIADGIYND